jgi:hypothetical protein
MTPPVAVMVGFLGTRPQVGAGSMITFPLVTLLSAMPLNQ